MKNEGGGKEGGQGWGGHQCRAIHKHLTLHEALLGCLDCLLGFLQKCMLLLKGLLLTPVGLLHCMQDQGKAYTPP